MAWCYSSLQLDSLEAASLTLLLTYTMNSLFWGEDDSQRVSPFPSFPDCLYLQSAPICGHTVCGCLCAIRLCPLQEVRL